MNIENNWSWKKEFSILFIVNAACLLLLAFRVYWSGSWYFVFLTWNLWLAFVPLLISWYLPSISSWWQKIGLLFLWVLFLPNAPYLITDLIHLRPRHYIPIWYDGILLFAFAFAGNWMGLRSLERCFTHFKLNINSAYTIIFLFALGWLLGYGVFLGRVLRFNSWDLFTRPIVVLQNAWNYVDDPRAVLMSCSFSILIASSYYVYVKMKEENVVQYS